MRRRLLILLFKFLALFDLSLTHLPAGRQGKPFRGPRDETNPLGYDK